MTTPTPLPPQKIIPTPLVVWDDLQFLVTDLHGILYCRQHAMLCFTTVFNLLCTCKQLALKHVWYLCGVFILLIPTYNLSRVCETTNVHCVHISRCQAVAKFCKDYESHTVTAGRDCILIIALPWGHINAPVEFVILKCYVAHALTGSVICSTMRCLLLPSNAHRPHPWDI